MIHQAKKVIGHCAEDCTPELAGHHAEKSVSNLAKQLSFVPQLRDYAETTPLVDSKGDATPSR